MNRIKKMSGKKIYLSPLCLDDAPVYAQWLNDLEVSRYLSLASVPLSAEQEREVLARLAKEHNYAIIDIASDELVGNVGLMDLDTLNRTAEIGIFLGDKTKWGNGMGREALLLMADYAFHVLGVRNLMLRAYEFNSRGLACYGKVGFKEIGRRRKARYWNGKYYDIVFMDLLADDFGPSHLPALKVE